MAASVTCARCGATVSAGARFCPTCGAPQEEARREERRVVTVLFGDIAGFTEMSERRDTEEVKRVVDATFERLARIVRDHGGTVDKVIGDEIMAVFGAPQAHEDDPERAVRAALAIQRLLADDTVSSEHEPSITLRMHMGINTGEVVAGYVGGIDSYTVVGDAVNTARRIADAAEAGQILVGDSTVEASQEAIAYRRIGTVAAKGKRLPVGIWEALEERGLPGERGPRAAPLIGRDEELTLLDTLTAMVRRDKRPIVATLIGDAGIGKSRLARTFAGRVRAAGVRVLDGRSLAYGSADPAFEVVEIVRAALSLGREADGDARGELKERLDRYGLVTETDALAPLLGLGGAVRVGRSADATEAPGTTAAPVGDAGSALEATRAVLERMASNEGGLVLVFHDLHWGGDTVLDFVESFLERSRAPILIVCLARPDLLERRPHWGEPLGSVVLPLEPLPRERAEEMLQILAPSLALDVRESVLERAGGNPFFLEELARLLADRSPSVVDGMRVPGSIQALVAARLDALPPEGKRIVQDAAVVGEVFWPGALRTLGSDPGDALDAPEVRELIEPAADPPIAGEHALRFRQTVVREVAYGSVPKNVRARHHAAIGAWLEQAGGERDPADLIAYHYERAATLSREIGARDTGVEAKAREFLERAGNQALSLDASRTAARFFERAVQFARDREDALTLRLRLGEALVGSWRHAEALSELERALEDARTLGDRSAEGRALRLLGDAYRMTGQGGLAREPIERALALAKELHDEAEEAAALRARGQLDLFQGRWQSSILWFRQALSRYRVIGDRRGEAWSLQNLGWASMFVRRLDDARAFLEEGEAIFAELGDEEGAGWCRGMRGWVSLLLGDLDAAAEIAMQLEGELRAHPEYLAGAGFVLDLQRILRAYVEVLRAHLVAATEAASSAFASADSVGVAWVHALGHYPVFLAAMLERRFDVAQQHLEAAADGAQRFGDPLYIGLATFARAWLAVERNDPDEAERLLDGLRGDDEHGVQWRDAAASRYLDVLIRRARGDARGALEAIESAPSLGTRGIAMVSSAWVRVLHAESLVDVDAERAIAVAEAAIVEAGEEIVTRLIAHRALAAGLLAAGRAADAERVLRDAMMMLDETDWRAERIRMLGSLARALDAQRRHDEAGEALDAARALVDAASPDADTTSLEEMLRA